MSNRYTTLAVSKKLLMCLQNVRLPKDSSWDAVMMRLYNRRDFEVYKGRLITKDLLMGKTPFIPDTSTEVIEDDRLFKISMETIQNRDEDKEDKTTTTDDDERFGTIGKKRIQRKVWKPISVLGKIKLGNS